MKLTHAVCACARACVRACVCVCVCDAYSRYIPIPCSLTQKQSFGCVQTPDRPVKVALDLQESGPADQKLGWYDVIRSRLLDVLHDVIKERGAHCVSLGAFQQENGCDGFVELVLF